jgi:chemotaxis protein MotB
MVIELFDLPDTPLFVGQTTESTPVLQAISALLAEVLDITENELAISGHVRSFPITLIENPAWAMSAARAQALRGLMQEQGTEAARFQRISGYADRKPVTPNPMAVRNNRLEVILLRRDP